jgi:hypothetical protein
MHWAGILVINPKWNREQHALYSPRVDEVR